MRLFVIVAAVVLVVLPLGASASSDERLVLTERMQLTSFDPATGNGTQAGTFVAAGAVDDSGTAAAVFHVGAAGGGCGNLTGPHTFTGSGGTITVFTKAVICPFPPVTTPRSFARGEWRVVGATGKYKGLRGHGKIVATADFSNGQITIARDGEVSGSNDD